MLLVLIQKDVFELVNLVYLRDQIGDVKLSQVLLSSVGDLLSHRLVQAECYL